MLDRFANGDPHNDNINGTVFERDSSSTQLRYGGDVLGLIDSLDYIQGMGVKVGGISMAMNEKPTHALFRASISLAPSS